VPAGEFTMGSEIGDDDERPTHRVKVPAFTIQRTEVTVKAYRACVASGACTVAGGGPRCNGARPEHDEHPINCVDWAQAGAFCAWRHARLPSEAEWEYAARGSDGRTYPWGNAKPAAQLCWDGPDSDLGRGKRNDTCVVGTHSPGQSPFGVEDLAGNVWEWVADPYTADYAGAPPEELRVARGGTWFAYDPADVRTAVRYRAFAEARGYGIGFRCASSTLVRAGEMR
jgi:formylglycine-generating enzyme required for sulfatase activity